MCMTYKEAFWRQRPSFDTPQMQTDFEAKNDIKAIISKFTAVAHDWDTDMRTLRCINNLLPA